MFGKSIKLFKLFGFEVKIDWSWFILALLITWSLAKGVFPLYFPHLETATYWWMGIGGAVGLFISIVFHEFSHSLVARSFGIPMQGITLFIFGGVAEMNDEPQNARSELLMAVAGPLSSVVLAGIFYVIYLLTRGGVWPVAVTGVLLYLAFINLLLAAFNMIPAFPLDGGRVLRAILWSWKKNISWATRISSRIGSGFGIVLIILGALDFIGGNFIGGVWLFLIGLFLRSVSHGSYQQLLLRNALEGENIDRFMRTDPVTVNPDVTLKELVEDYFYKYHYKMFPVTNGARTVNCISIDLVKEIPREKWETTRVRDIAHECSQDNTLEIHSNAVKALTAMRRTGNSRFLVMDHGHLAGIVTMKDIFEFLSMKMDLEEHK